MPKKTKSGISKGPWRMVRFPAARGDDWRVVEDADKKVVGEIQHIGNARLIEMAPDLLRLAKKALDIFEGRGQPYSIIEPLRTLIAKSEGH